VSIWKQLFGESQKDAWTRLANEIGGQLREGGWGSATAVHARLGGYDIVLDTYTVSTGKSSQTYTRVQAPFANAAGLRFRIHRASIFTGIAKAFGKQDIEIGVPDFDRDFVIQGNDEARVQQLLSDEALRAMIEAQPHISLGIDDGDGSIFSTKYGPLVDLLTLTQGGVVKDVPLLSGQFALFAVLLRAFQRNGHPLDVPNAEIPAAFADLLDDVVGALGATLERTRDSLAARIEDPLGITGEARLIVAIPAMPKLTTTIAFDAALPPGPVVTVKPRGMFGGSKTGVAEVDEHITIDGDVTSERARALLRPLSRLARYKPEIVASDASLKLDIRDMIAHDGLIAVGAALDLWQEIVRQRAGL
jgi:hypothetical protein